MPFDKATSKVIIKLNPSTYITSSFIFSIGSFLFSLISFCFFEHTHLFIESLCLVENWYLFDTKFTTESNLYPLSINHSTSSLAFFNLINSLLENHLLSFSSNPLLDIFVIL